jgi:hypothetical protein
MGEEIVREFNQDFVWPLPGPEKTKYLGRTGPGKLRPANRVSQGCT